MTTAHDDEPQPSRLVDAVRAHLADPSDQTRMAVVRNATYPLGRTDMPDEVKALEEVLRGVLDGELDDHERALNDVGWYDRMLRPTGRLRVVAEDWQADDSGDPELAGLTTERPAPVDQDEADIAWQVRRLRINDEARTRYNAERNTSSIPEAMDVAAVIRGEVELMRPTMLTRADGVSLVYPGLLHWVFGPPSTGKTMFAVFGSAQMLNRGAHVGYLDWEGTRAIVGERLQGRVDPDVVAERFHYYKPGNLEPHSEWLAEQARTSWHLCIIDGFAKACAASGKNEEFNPDVLAWLVAVVQPLTDNGCAVIVLDHVTKDRETRDQARGAGAKGGEASVTYEVRIGQPFNRRREGHLKLVQRKDREGNLGIDGEVFAELHVLPKHGFSHLELRPPARSAADLARARAMEKAYQAVENWTAANGGQEPSTTQVWKVYGGHKATLNEMLDELADLGHLHCVRQGNGKPTTWQTITPYFAPVPDPTPGPLTIVSDWDVLRGE